jgi:predicted Zn-dependent protease
MIMIAFNRFRFAFVILLVIVCFFAAGGCASDRAVIGQANQVHGSLDPAVINDPELANYFQQVGDRVIDVAKELDQQHYGPKSHFNEKDDWMFSNKMKFHLVNSKTLNAFTTGGEHMYVYNELFLQCRSEDELAAVMAHEYGHVYARHVHKGMNRQMAALGFAGAAGVAGAAVAGENNRSQGAATGAGVGLLAAQFANMGFTRGDEAEADKLGFKFYTMAGWDPNKFGDFFQHMIDKGYDKTPAMLSDHPSLKSRVEDAKKRAAELPPNAKEWRREPVASASRFKQLQDRAAQLAKTLPNDKSLANSQELLQALPRSCVAPIDPPDAQQARADLDRKAKAQQKKTK